MLRGKIIQELGISFYEDELLLLPPNTRQHDIGVQKRKKKKKESKNVTVTATGFEPRTT